MPGLAVRLICEGTGQGAVSTPPLDSGGHVQHGVPGQRVMEHESAAVLINGDQEGQLKVRDAIQHAGAARGGDQDTEVPGPLQCRKQEQRAAHRGQAANPGSCHACECSLRQVRAESRKLLVLPARRP